MYRRSSGRIFALLTLALAIVVTLTIACSSRALAQQPPPTTEERISSLEQEFAGLGERVDGLSSLVNLALIFVGLFFALTAGVSVVGFFRAESRAAESHALAVKGEGAAQDRADAIHTTFLASSKDTVELVNATLQLAKDASESAAKSIEREASKRLKTLDGQARLLIAKVPEEDVHELVSNPTLRSELNRLANQIDSFETNRLILPQILQLTPHALFIRGMHFHLDQHCDESLECWQEVAVHTEEASTSLKTLAWYWIGREQNNLARFREAEQSFTNARNGASPVMDLELQRNIIEAQFFNKDQASAFDLVGPLEDLLKKAEARGDIDRVRTNKVIIKIFTTLGNVRTEAGDESRDPKEKIAHYVRALNNYEQADDQDKWALFGKAEILYRLERFDEAYPIYNRVRRLVADEYHRRTEPRTKTAAREVELICCVRVPEFWEEAPTARDNVIDELDQVEDRLTIYSEVQRRTVRKPEFRAEIDKLMREFEERRSQPTLLEGAPRVDGDGEHPQAGDTV